MTVAAAEEADAEAEAKAEEAEAADEAALLRACSALTASLPFTPPTTAPTTIATKIVRASATAVQAQDVVSLAHTACASLGWCCGLQSLLRLYHGRRAGAGVGSSTSSSVSGKSSLLRNLPVWPCWSSPRVSPYCDMLLILSERWYRPSGTGRLWERQKGASFRETGCMVRGLFRPAGESRR